MIRIEPSKLHHCGVMARHMTAWQRQHIPRSVAHRQIAALLGASYAARTGFLGDQIIGMGGITGTIASETGFVWLVIRDIPPDLVLPVIREMRSQFLAMASWKREIVSTVMLGDEKAMRLARFFGFKERPGTRTQSSLASVDMIEIVRTM